MLTQYAKWLTYLGDRGRIANQGYDVLGQATKIGWLSDGSEPSAGKQVDRLAKQTAEIAMRLAALPADGLRNNIEVLNSIEQLALQILKEVSAVRAGKSHVVGETRGMWRALQPVEHR